MYPEELKYNEEHTWLKMESEDTGRVGITVYAQDQLKDVVYVDLPEVGTEVSFMEPFGVVESIKATNDLYSPVTGEVVEVNEALSDEPGLVNKGPYSEGWMIVVKLSDTSELDKLMSADDYKATVS